MYRNPFRQLPLYLYSESEASLPDSVIVYKNTELTDYIITIPKKDLVPGHWYKIAVASRSGAESLRKSIYICKLKSLKGE